MKRIDEILTRLRAHANPKNVEGMARFGINPKNTLGISIPVLRRLAREIGKDHALATALWKSGIHEARILAAFVDEPEQVTAAQMDRWVKGFDSWDVCDQVCANLFWRTPFAVAKAVEWSKDEREFVKRAGFALMAALAWHNEAATDTQFKRFFPAIKRGALDERNFVKKAVNWALRQIGKRNSSLNKKSIKLAREIQKLDSKSARWIAADALRELTSRSVRNRLKK
jgi:3-methyladenine DNA glycosylase AlkD